jgi:hypothetical protein
MLSGHYATLDTASEKQMLSGHYVTLDTASEKQMLLDIRHCRCEVEAIWPQHWIAMLARGLSVECEDCTNKEVWAWSGRTALRKRFERGV